MQQNTLILLLYYQRPMMVLEALKSVAEQTTGRWTLVAIDDSDPSFIDNSGKMSRGYWPPLSEWMEQCFTVEQLESQVHCVTIGDSAQQKLEQGGSRVGTVMNQLLEQTDCDTAIMLCDDDALISDYIENGQRYFANHPNEMWAYSHVRIYDPTSELPGPHISKRPYFTNREGIIYPSCAVDASQVMWRPRIHKESHVQFPSPQTKDLDAAFYAHLSHVYGPGNFMGFDGQYKGIFDDQLGNRGDDWYTVKDK